MNSQKQLFKDLRQLLVKMKIKCERGIMAKTEKEEAEFMNAIIDINEDIEEIVKNEVEIDLRSTGEQVHFSFASSPVSPQLRIWLKIINMSSKELTLTSMKWELWIQKFICKTETSFALKIKPKYIEECNIEVMLNNVSMNLDDETSNLKGKAFFDVEGKRIEKEFNLKNIKYTKDCSIGVEKIPDILDDMNGKK